MNTNEYLMLTDALWDACAFQRNRIEKLRKKKNHEAYEDEIEFAEEIIEKYSILRDELIKRREAELK